MKPLGMRLAASGHCRFPGRCVLLPWRERHATCHSLLSQIAHSHIPPNLPSNLSCHDPLFKKTIMQESCKEEFRQPLLQVEIRMIWCKVNVFSWDYRHVGLWTQFLWLSHRGTMELIRRVWLTENAVKVCIYHAFD